VSVKSGCDYSSLLYDYRVLKYQFLPSTSFIVLLTVAVTLH
jgi:hypothetical protein